MNRSSFPLISPLMEMALLTFPAAAPGSTGCAAMLRGCSGAGDTTRSAAGEDGLASSCLRHTGTSYTEAPEPQEPETSCGGPERGRLNGNIVQPEGRVNRHCWLPNGLCA